MTMTHGRNLVSITLGELTLEDQGREVVITTEHAAIAGVLTTYLIDQEMIDVTEFGTPPDESPKVILGAKRVQITVGEWTAEQLPISTRVEVYR